MARFIKSRKDTHGASPGSLIFIGNKKMEKAEIRLLVYNQENVAEKKIESLNDIPAELSDNEIAWIDIYGLHEPEIVAGVGERFAIHTLEQEDIMNTDQRPKVVEKDDNFTFFLKILKFNEEIEKITSDQVTIVLRKNTVITFQEKPAHYFEPVRERIRKGVGKIRSSGADYLAYTLIDTLVDGYLHSIEKLGFRLESMEEEVLYDSNKKTVEKIYRLKNNIGFLRKSIFPLKEIMIILNKSESDLIQRKTFQYLKDLSDLVTQALEAVEIYHNMANDYLNIYHSNAVNRTNDVMKVLTIFASIFIPLTFIASVYGTNFDYLPELHFKYAYFIMLAAMVLVAAGMLIFFRKKRWL